MDTPVDLGKGGRETFCSPPPLVSSAFLSPSDLGSKHHLPGGLFAQLYYLLTSLTLRKGVSQFVIYICLVLCLAQSPSTEGGARVSLLTTVTQSPVRGLAG